MKDRAMAAGGFVEIGGSAREVGSRMGRLAAAAISGRVAAARRAAGAAGVAERLLASRVREFASHIERVSPMWLDEAAGIAEGARVATDDVLMLNCLPAAVRTPGDAAAPDAPPCPDGSGCTSFLRVEAERSVLFKIRDYRPGVQLFVVRTAPGPDDDATPMQTSTGAGDLGAAHVFTGRAVAGACNTGSPSARVSDEPRLNDCHMIRWIAERARGVADVPRLAGELIDARAAGGAGGDRGSILLFAGPDGGVVVQTVHDDLAWEEVAGGTFVASNHFIGGQAEAWRSSAPDEGTLLRKARMEELLAGEGGLAPARVYAISRDRANVPFALCNDDAEHPWMTVSAALHLIDRREPSRSSARVCCGNPRHSLFLPVPVTETRSFAPLASGEFYVLSDALYRRHRSSDHLAAEQARVEREGASFGEAAADAYGTLCRLAGEDGRAAARR